tara:strand:+ start:81245 stop:83371 length:2127 start_codon:yes stop_codon:yes gene_type:complete
MGFQVKAGLGWVLAGTAALALIGCQSQNSAQNDQPDMDESAKAAAAKYMDSASGDDWPGYGRTYGEQHYSPLDEINTGNVEQLGLVWSHDLGDGQSNTLPIEVGGTLYLANRTNLLHAIDVESGKELWQYDPKAQEASGFRNRQSWGSRGISWWNGKIYTGTMDGRLIAVDAKTGKEVWSALTVDPKDNVRYISGAPRIFNGKVIVGHGGADSGPGVRGYVTAYDAETGKELWRFYTVPGQPGVDNDWTTKMAAKTWAGEWWKMGGGGCAWNAMAYDPETDTVFIGTGNGYPWNYRIRSKGKGDNLFLSSVVALDGKTGAYKWHYQTVPAETWDYNSTMDIEFADLKIDGKMRKVLLHAPKNGFFYVIDRLNGELISAEPFAKVTWASHIDMKTGRPVENPGQRYENQTVSTVWPSLVGAHGWLPMAYSPKSQLAYLPTVELANAWNDKGVDYDNWKQPQNNIGDTGASAEYYPEGVGAPFGTSYLQAWDPVTQKQIWKVPTPGPFSGGVVATGGGLVFQGSLDGKFTAYSEKEGKVVWSFDAGAPVLAPPISFSHNGKQYVTVITGIGNSHGLFGKLMPSYISYRNQARRVLTFALGGKATIPPFVKGQFKPIEDKEYRPDAAAQARGMAKFELICSLCHGFAVGGGGTAPDLRTSAVPLNWEAFRSVVHDGALVPNGMPRFQDLDDQTLQDIRQYIRAKAQEKNKQ